MQLKTAPIAIASLFLLIASAATISFSWAQTAGFVEEYSCPLDKGYQEYADGGCMTSFGHDTFLIHQSQCITSGKPTIWQDDWTVGTKSKIVSCDANLPCASTDTVNCFTRPTCEAVGGWWCATPSTISYNPKGYYWMCHDPKNPNFPSFTCLNGKPSCPAPTPTPTTTPTTNIRCTGGLVQTGQACPSTPDFYGLIYSFASTGSGQYHMCCTGQCVEVSGQCLSGYASAGVIGAVGSQVSVCCPSQTALEPVAQAPAALAPEGCAVGEPKVVLGDVVGFVDENNKPITTAKVGDTARIVISYKNIGTAKAVNKEILYVQYSPDRLTSIIPKIFAKKIDINLDPGQSTDIILLGRYKFPEPEKYCLDINKRLLLKNSKTICLRVSGPRLLYHLGMERSADYTPGFSSDYMQIGSVEIGVPFGSVIDRDYEKTRDRGALMNSHQYMRYKNMLEEDESRIFLPTTSHSGVVDHATKFDGSVTFVELINAKIGAKLDLADQNDFSIAGWIKIPEAPPFEQHIFQVQGVRMDGVSAPTAAVIIDENGLRLRWEAQGSGTVITDAIPIKPKKWVYVTGVWKKNEDGASLTGTLYVNGEKLTSKASALLPQSEKYPLIGASSMKKHFKGLIDEVKIYDGILSDIDIKKLYESYNLPQSIIAQWPLDIPNDIAERVRELSDQENIGSLMDGSNVGDGKKNGPVWVKGRVGYSSAKFDGVDDYAKFQQELPIEDEFSVGFWVKTPRVLPETEQHIIQVLGKDISPVSSYPTAAVIIDSNGLALKWLAGKDIAGTAGNPSCPECWDLHSKVPLNRWVHVTGVWRKNQDPQSVTASLYIDGESQGSKNSGLLIQSEKHPILGASAETGRNFKGRLDDVRIWDGPLSDAAVVEVYNSYNKIENVNIGTWLFNEGKGATAEQYGTLKDGLNIGDGINNGPKWIKGNIGTALEFDGIGDYVGVDEEVDLKNENELTAITWIKIPPTLPSSPETILQIQGSEFDGISVPTASIFIDSKGLGIKWLAEKDALGKDSGDPDCPECWVLYYDHNNDPYLQPTEFFDRWIRVEAVWERVGDGKTVKATLYVDEGKKGSRKSGLLKALDFYPIIGADSSGHHFKSSIDDTIIYDGSRDTEKCRLDKDCSPDQKCEQVNNKCILRNKCESVIKNGDSKEKKNIVFIADDPNLRESTESFKQRITEFAKRDFFSIEPIKSRQQKFNIWSYVPDNPNIIPASSIVTSSTKGPELQVGAVGLLDSVAKASRKCPSDFVVVKSDNTFRSVTSTGENAAAFVSGGDYSVAIHELGHLIFNLADEYVEAGKPKVPHAPNCASSIEEAISWWGDLIDKEGIIFGNVEAAKAQWPGLPETDYHILKDGKVAVLNVGPYGFYTGREKFGCSYTNDNVRSTENSIMNNHRVVDGFRRVNERHMINIMDKWGIA